MSVWYVPQQAQWSMPMSKEYIMRGYDQLVLNGSFEVQIYEGDREEVNLEGPDHILEDIAVSQRFRK